MSVKRKLRTLVLPLVAIGSFVSNGFAQTCVDDPTDVEVQQGTFAVRAMCGGGGLQTANCATCVAVSIKKSFGGPVSAGDALGHVDSGTDIPASVSAMMSALDAITPQGGDYTADISGGWEEYSEDERDALRDALEAAGIPPENIHMGPFSEGYDDFRVDCTTKGLCRYEEGYTYETEPEIYNLISKWLSKRLNIMHDDPKIKWPLKNMATF